MKDAVSIRHHENMAFDVKINGHDMVLDSTMEFGGENKGPRPKSLLLAALGGCTGMDVISILGKMKVGFEDFRIIVEGNITDEHPRHFDRMHITFIFKGKDLPEEKIKDAIMLSQDKYCGVSYSFRKAMEITWELKIED